MLCVLIGATMSVTEGTAQAVPERVLQSVRIEVAPDGSITAVESQAVRKAGDADATTEVENFAPADVASDLPVRVLTSYRLGDRSGTDLSDIEGESGRVVIQVTVQNTTVRPEELAYESADGDRRTTTALVGTPLTIIGSAQLGEGELARIVTSNDSVPTEITDGVVSRGDDGRARVQWAAMLAPPRLAPSATFTLVEETADFEVPSFDFSVQPGLVTDASVSQLIDSAFSDEGDSTLKLESRTIEIIGSVNTVLADASGVLNDIQSTLDRSAGDLGRRTVGELRAGRDRVDSSLTGTISQLEQLDADIKSELSTTTSQTLDVLGSTVGDIKELLGQANTPAPDLDFVGSCEKYRTVDKKFGNGPGMAEAPRSVLYRMRLVGAQLGALTALSGSCTQEIQDGLKKSVGVKGQSCRAASVSAICALDETITELGERSRSISEFGTNLKDLTPRSSIADLRLKIDAVTSGLRAVEDAADAVRPKVFVAGDLREGALDVKTQLESVKSLLEGLTFGDLADEYGDISNIADSQLTLLGTRNTPGSVKSQVDDLTDRLGAACALVDLDGIGDLDLTDLPQSAMAFLLGDSGTCDGVDPLVSALGVNLDQLTGAWNDVKGAVGDLEREVRRLTNLQGQVLRKTNEVLDQLNTVISEAGEPDQVEAELEELFVAVKALSDADSNVVGDVCAAPAEPRRRAEVVAPVNQMRASFEAVNCDSVDLLAAIDGKMAEFTTVIDTAGTQVGSSVTATDDAREAAEVTVQSLTTGLSNSIQAAGDGIVRRTSQQIMTNQGALDLSKQAANMKITGLSDEASTQLTKQVTASNKDLGSTNKELQGDLASVLLDLGSRGAEGTGILGTLSSSARRTGASNADLSSAAQQASAFRSIRGQVLSDIRLQQSQTNRSLELTSQFPSLGLDVPEGSRVLTVFSFHIGN